MVGILLSKTTSPFAKEKFHCMLLSKYLKKILLVLYHNMFILKKILIFLKHNTRPN
jgi:hypothetical protein